MTNDTNDVQNAMQRTEIEPTEAQYPCPDCGVAVGEAHIDDQDDGGCDIARCLETGLQRVTCEHEHDCGLDVWTGWWPGDLDCERLGLMLAPGLPDLNRLYAEAIWDPVRRIWVKPTAIAAPATPTTNPCAAEGPDHDQRSQIRPT